MAGGDWRGFAMEEAELLSGRLKNLLSSGQAYVRSHLGLDLGLAPELYPTWLMLATAGMGALLLLAVSWAAICGGGGGGKSKRSIRVVTRGGPPVAKTPVTKTVKPEETKKRNAKKAWEKKLQPNGKPAAALVVQQEVKVPKVLSKLHPPSTKTRKAPEAQPPVQLKKDKKKSKISVKPAQHVITHDGKELDEGAWETKVSIREKKQQRRKDKGADSFSGQEGTPAAQSHVESNSNVKKKNKGANDSQNSKSAAKASSSQGGDGVNSGGWTDFSAMVTPTHMGSTEPNKFGSHYHTRAEPRSWSQESQGGAQTWVANIKSDHDPVSLSMLRLNATPDPLSKWTVDLHWTTHADDEWGGTKGADSDWNAPAEHWGNYEEPPVVTRLLTQLKQRTLTNKVSGDSDDPAEGAAKSKKKRKKKTASKEEGIPEAQAVNSLPKPEDLPVAASKKPSISSTRKRPEKNAGNDGGGNGKKRQEKGQKGNVVVT
ncbi:protein LYRIC-like isoform X2 [Hippocampus zosterae]|uniref:protein LYRIC-like isoform X2 n=1 Tax=Hippocampus zosterae TaxID=109293 RepID=UPI00223E28CF|nr:protein LYRIC-like isoform X2 [Hippocampus zosterae]